MNRINWMNRKEFFQSQKGKAHLFRQRKLQRVDILIKGIEPQSKNMRDADKDELQRQVMKALDDEKQPAYRGPIALEIDLATTSRTAPQAQTIAKNLLDLLSIRRASVQGTRNHLLYNDDSQVHALSVSCRHGQDHPYISIQVRRFSRALKDLELAAEAFHSDNDAPSQEYEEGESIDSFKDLLRNETQSRTTLGDALYDAMFKMTRWSAQRALLKRSRITIASLAQLYELPKNTFATPLYIDWNNLFQNHPLRVTLGELPQAHGASDAFKREIDSKITEFKRLLDWVIQPLVVPAALEVIVRPSPTVPRGVLHDLDNVVRDYLLPKFVPAFGTVSDHTWTIDFDELARRDPDLRKRWDDSPTPPIGTRDGVTRYEVWRLPPASDRSKGFVSVALVADDAFHESGFRQIDHQVSRWENELEN
jgi:hypothetical protein